MADHVPSFMSGVRPGGGQRHCAGLGRRPHARPLRSVAGVPVAECPTGPASSGCRRVRPRRGTKSGTSSAAGLAARPGCRRSLGDATTCPPGDPLPTELGVLPFLVKSSHSECRSSSVVAPSPDASFGSFSPVAMESRALRSGVSGRTRRRRWSERLGSLVVAVLAGVDRVHCLKRRRTRQNMGICRNNKFS